MKRSLIIFAAMLALSTSILAKDKAKKAPDGAPDHGDSLAMYLLKQLNEREQIAYEKFERAIMAEDVDQVKRELQSVVDGYDALITQSPDFASAYVSYGLMLNRIGESKASYAMFLKADELDPNVAVVKNQLGNHMAESGKYGEAYGFYLLAIDLAPRESLYQYQAGNLLVAYRKFFIQDKLFNPKKIDEEIQERFRKAAKLSPKEQSYRLRYAQSFFDIDNPNWEVALETWQDLMGLAESEQERQMVILYMARVRAEMGHYSAVRKLLSKVDYPEYMETRQNLLDSLTD